MDKYYLCLQVQVQPHTLVISVIEEEEGVGMQVLFASFFMLFQLSIHLVYSKPARPMDFMNS